MLSARAVIRRTFGPMKTTKRCPRHNNGKGELLPVSAFYSDRSTPDGFSGYCKDCSKERRRQHYAETGTTLRSRYLSLRTRARLRGIPFNLSFETFLNLLAGCCAYGSGKSPQLLMEIDRKTQEIGYTEENCVSSCQRHNSIKGKVLKHESMLQIVRLFPEAEECGDRRTLTRKFEPSGARRPMRNRKIVGDLQPRNGL